MDSPGIAVWKLSDLVLTLHCPACGCQDVRRSRRKNPLELCVTLLFFLRPFRCEKCFYRFYDHVFRRTVAASESRDLSQTHLTLPVVVYGCGANGEIFHEDTTLTIFSAHSSKDPGNATLVLTVPVEPGQELILMYPDSEQEQRCRVAFARTTRGGTCVARIHFAGPAQKFSRITRPEAWQEAS